MKTGSNIFMGLAAFVVLLPIVVVSAAALNGGRSMLFPPQDPTLSRFAEFFLQEPVWRNAMINSVVIAVGSAALAVLLAWPLAFGIWKQGGKGAQVLAGLGAMP
ncbi:MAG: ABC transporter permease, partial [Pseudomonadota bacterium]